MRPRHLHYTVLSLCYTKRKTEKYNAQYTPPTRRNCFVASASAVWRQYSQLAHDDCRRIRSTIRKLTKQTPGPSTSEGDGKRESRVLTALPRIPTDEWHSALTGVDQGVIQRSQPALCCSSQLCWRRVHEAATATTACSASRASSIYSERRTLRRPNCRVMDRTEQSVWEVVTIIYIQQTEDDRRSPTFIEERHS